MLPRLFIKTNKTRKRSQKIITFLLDRKEVKIISSLFNESEISGYFRDYLRFIKGLNLGYDYTNCHKYKQNFLLSKEEKKERTSYFEDVSNQDVVEVVELQLDGKSLDFFRIATCDYYLDYMDVFHLIVALIEGCKYLITEDKDFKKKGNELLRDNSLIEKIRLVDGKEAMNYLKIR